jgi:hypothetical protein
MKADPRHSFSTTLNTYATENANFIAFPGSLIYRGRIAAIRKAAPAGSAHDAMPWQNFPRMKSHLALKSAVTGPVTGNSGEVFTPTSVDSAKALEVRRRSPRLSKSRGDCTEDP